MAYLTRAQLRAHLGYRPEFVEDDAQMDAALAAADALVDDYCGRTFEAPGSADARIYDSSRLRTLTIDDVSDTATAVVETSSDRSTWTTENTDDYYWDVPTGFPAVALCRISDAWPAGWVRVTAEHGWTAVPEPVTAATKLVASQLLSRRHSPNGIEVGGDFGAVRSSKFLDSTAQLLLAPYRRVSAYLGVA